MNSPQEDDRPSRHISQSSWPSLGSGPSKSRRPVSGKFLKVVPKKSHDDPSGCRAPIARTLENPWFVNFMVILILLDFVITIMDVDARAAGRTSPVWNVVVAEVCLGIYTGELAAVFYVSGFKRACKNKAVIFDIACVLSGFLATFARFAGTGLPSEAQFLADFKVMRVLRILRVARIIRKTRSLRELQKLISMMSTCLKALGWSFIFCFAFMTLWAILLVELVHPLMEQMYRDGNAFQECVDCPDQASSVMRANLLLFKTVIAGDSWGRIAMPVIEEYPATAIIFCGSLLTVVFGVMNMVVAVMVDSFAESRQKDVLNLAEELEHEGQQDKTHLEEMFKRLDAEANGDVTLEQLVDGAKTDPDFQSRLRVMDIDEGDLEQLFHMIDVDMSGAINKEEFVGPLSRWILDSKTAPRFVKYNVEQVLLRQEEMLKLNQAQFDLLGNRLDELCSQLLPKIGFPSHGEISENESEAEGDIEQPQFSAVASMSWKPSDGIERGGMSRNETKIGPSNGRSSFWINAI